MQEGLISCILILSFVSPCLCINRWNFGFETNGSTYNMMNYGAKGDGKYDDSNAFISAWNNACGVEGTPTLVIPKGKVFLLKNLEIKGPCKASTIHVQVLGDIVAPTKDEWGDVKKPLITISKVNSLIIDGGGHIEGNGNNWWTCKECSRPRLLQFRSCTKLRVSKLNLANSPGAHISVNGCNDARFVHMNINAPQNSPNTDAYDVSNSTNVVFEDSTLAIGDDCIAINGGSSFIYANRLACGPGHGISIGSLGKNNGYETVEEVHVKDCTFTGTTNGARIKTWEGGSGYARKISFENISLIKTKNPIVIDQHYGTKNPNKEATSLEVSDVTFKGFEGSCVNEKAIKLECSKKGCFNIIMDNINIGSNDPNKKAQATCENAHGHKLGQVSPNVPCLL